MRALPRLPPTSGAPRAPPLTARLAQVEDFVHYAELESGWDQSSTKPSNSSSSRPTTSHQDPAVLPVSSSPTRRPKGRKTAPIDYMYMDASEGPRLGVAMKNVLVQRSVGARQPFGTIQKSVRCCPLALALLPGTRRAPWHRRAVIIAMKM